jgi:SAM-dependent methyltransferase
MYSQTPPPQPLCPVCHAADMAVFFTVCQVPVYCNVLCPTRDEALHISRGDIQLGCCPSCGHMANLAFEPARLVYSQNYENSLHFSPRFQSYATDLARYLVHKHLLYGKDILEIGCGQGEFLQLLCTLGKSRGIGFDSSYRQERLGQMPADQITFIPDAYSERYAHYQADLLCCRHVLEHIAQPQDFLRMVRRAIGTRQNTVVFFEVPNGLCTLRDLAIWDILYEHCSYFSPSSLARLCVAGGFDVCTLRETFAGQFLCLEARPTAAATGAPPAAVVLAQPLMQEVTSFAERFQRKKAHWEQQLAHLEAHGQRCVVWGAGSKGVTFLNMLHIRDQIEYVVDINRRKQGMYVAGSGQGIVAPEFLQACHPDVVLVMNSIYRQEVQQRLDSMGVKAALVTA